MWHPHYLQVKKGKRIFFKTNFSLKEKQKVLLLFNYGLACSNLHWKYLIKYLEKFYYSMVLHDYPGYFNSTIHDDMHENFESMVDDISELLRELQYEKIILLGHSMGVNITLEYALRKKTDGIILISGSIYPPDSIMFNTHIFSYMFNTLESLSYKIPMVFNNFWKVFPYINIFQKMIKNGGFNSSKAQDEFIFKYLLRIQSLGYRNFFHYFNLMKEHKIRYEIDKITTKALIISGDKDHLIPNQYQLKLFKLLKNSEIYKVKDGSHVPQVDFYENVGDRIHLFVQNILL